MNSELTTLEAALRDCPMGPDGALELSDEYLMMVLGGQDGTIGGNAPPPPPPPPPPPHMEAGGIPPFLIELGKEAARTLVEHYAVPVAEWAWEQVENAYTAFHDLPSEPAPGVPNSGA